MGDEYLEKLTHAPTQHMRRILVRCVGLLPLIEGGKPDYLLTTGEADRYNLDGVRCIYFAEDERTAHSEHRCQLRSASGMHQPVCAFFAEVNLARVLDLGNASVRRKFGITARDLRAAWERAKKPIKTQLLGSAVSRLGTIAAIRYPSDAARAKGFRGYNVVIFRDSVRRPDFVRVLGSKRPLQAWP